MMKKVLFYANYLGSIHQCIVNAFKEFFRVYSTEDVIISCASDATIRGTYLDNWDMIIWMYGAAYNLLDPYIGSVPIIQIRRGTQPDYGTEYPNSAYNCYAIDCTTDMGANFKAFLLQPRYQTTADGIDQAWLYETNRPERIWIGVDSTNKLLHLNVGRYITNFNKAAQTANIYPHVIYRFLTEFWDVNWLKPPFLMYDIDDLYYNTPEDFDPDSIEWVVKWMVENDVKLTYGLDATTPQYKALTSTHQFVRKLLVAHPKNFKPFVHVHAYFDASTDPSTTGISDFEMVVQDIVNDYNLPSDFYTEYPYIAMPNNKFDEQLAVTAQVKGLKVIRASSLRGVGNIAGIDFMKNGVKILHSEGSQAPTYCSATAVGDAQAFVNDNTALYQEIDAILRCMSMGIPFFHHGPQFQGVLNQNVTGYVALNYLIEGLRGYDWSFTLYRRSPETEVI